MPAAVLQRILLCINPVISQSVQRVYDLALLHEDLKAASALRMVAIWQWAQRAEQPAAAESKPAATPAAAPREPQRSLEQRRGTFSMVRSKIAWDKHAQSRKNESA